MAACVPLLESCTLGYVGLVHLIAPRGRERLKQPDGRGVLADQAYAIIFDSAGPVSHSTHPRHVDVVAIGHNHPKPAGACYNGAGLPLLQVAAPSVSNVPRTLSRPFRSLAQRLYLSMAAPSRGHLTIIVVLATLTGPAGAMMMESTPL
jgi:hypothetical protein